MVLLFMIIDLFSFIQKISNVMMQQKKKKHFAKKG